MSYTSELFLHKLLISRSITVSDIVLASLTIHDYIVQNHVIFFCICERLLDKPCIQCLSLTNLFFKMFYYLCRWRIVIHGGIDGFSRLVVYLGASTNNRAETVLNLFKNAVRNYGIPSRVRSDKGGENRDVATFMVHHRGTNRNSHIAGRSVHNQRYVKSQELILCRATHMPTTGGHFCEKNVAF